jgi:hypothetical protein
MLRYFTIVVLPVVLRFRLGLDQVWSLDGGHSLFSERALRTGTGTHHAD